MNTQTVQTTIPRPEHPNPQFRREQWYNLNGTWDFKFDFGVSGIDRQWYIQTEYDHTIQVPFCPESKLSGIEYTDFIPCCWYHRHFSITSDQAAQRTLIHFGAVDYEAHIYINGQEVCVHRGGYASFCADITNFIHIGENDITVCAIDDVRSMKQPRGKQSTLYYSHGCDYTRTTGIWQTVWLEFMPETHITAVRYYPNIAETSVIIEAHVQGSGTLKAEASYHGEPCGSAQVRCENSTAFLTLKLSSAHLWQLGEGHLYDLVLTFGEDRVESYFGLREVRIDGMRFMLNGKSVFQRLILDQGFYPDGIYTAPDDGALEKDILLSMASGFNGARLHQKVFEQRFLYYCDLHGYMVWGETGSWGSDTSDYTTYKAIEPEWLEIIARDVNHPAIIGWCPFNETWDIDGRKQDDAILEQIYKVTRLYDPTRPCIDTSGNFHVITDIFDLHDYEQNPEIFAGHYEDFKNGTGPFIDAHADRQHYTKGLPVFLSEYGGIKWAPDKKDNAWGYGDAPKTEAEFIDRYDRLTTALLDNPNMMGFCYTQLTDVEQECNGIYYYDRTPKFDVSIFRRINTKKAAIED